MKLKEGKTGCVYLIRNEDNGLLKIGYTNNLERRLKKTGCQLFQKENSFEKD